MGLDVARGVTGRVVFGPESGAFSRAVVRVRLEDVSRADAAARVVAEQVIRDVSHKPGADEVVAFGLDGEWPDDRCDYVVRVHVDLNGDGQVKRGDYVSVESHPVLTRGHPREVAVRVHRVE